MWLRKGNFKGETELTPYNSTKKHHKNQLYQTENRLDATNSS